MTSRRNRLPTAAHGPGWPLLAVLVAGIAAVALVWFALSGRLAGSSDQKPSHFTEGLVGAPARINPLFVHLNDVDRDIASLVFSGLTRLGPGGEVLPDLADSWDVSPDGLTFTFHLHPGVIWHTGAPFTSADVLFTYGLLANPKLQADPDQAPLWRGLKCSAPNDITLGCQLPEPFAPFLSFTTVGILPKHILQGVDPAALFDHSFNQNPVGTGPFRLAQMDQNRALLRANTAYYLGQPQLSEIEFRFYPDTSTAAAGLVRRDIQGLLLGPTASPADFDTLRSTDGLKAYTANRTAHTVLYLNNSQPPFDDPSVRKAIAQAVDIDTLIGDLLKGRAVRANSPIVPGTWAFNPDLPPYSHDPDKARALLDGAGWALPQDGRVRERDGTELRVSLLTDGDPLRGAIAEEIARQLAEVGIAATVVRQDSADLVRDFLIPRQYQAAIFGWDPGPDPDPYPAWDSSQISDNGRNLAAYANPEADKVLEEARRTLDLDRRTALYYTFQQIFHDDVPSLPLYYPVYTYFVSSQIKGVQLGTLFYPSSRFRNVQQWTLQKSQDIRGP